jgi:thioredoxin-like negative regulator of GroEL
MSNVVDIQAKDFDSEITGLKKPVVVEFWTKSCGNCSKFKSVYEKLAAVFADRLRFVRVNMFESVENLRLAEGLGVEETPTVKVFYRNKEIGQMTGFRPLETATEELEAMIEKI